MTLFAIFLRSALRDRTTLFWSLIFPILAIVVAANTLDPTTDRRPFLGAMIFLSAAFFAASGTVFVVLSHRVRGIYKLVRLSPTRTARFVAVFGTTRACVALIAAVVVGLVGALVLRVQLTAAALLLTLLAVLLVIVAFTFVGFAIGNVAKDETQAAALNNLVTLPVLFLSTTFFSRSALPHWALPVLDGLPFEHTLSALRGALVGDWSEWARHTPWLIGFGALALVLSVRTFRWEPDGAR